EGIGQPFHSDAGLPFEFVGEVLRKVGVGTFVIAVDLEPARHLANSSDAHVFAGELKHPANFDKYLQSVRRARSREIGDYVCLWPGAEVSQGPDKVRFR